VRVAGEEKPLYIRISDLAQSLGIEPQEASEMFTGPLVSDPTARVVDVVFHNAMKHISGSDPARFAAT
jgi:hypothetical protein